MNKIIFTLFFKAIIATQLLAQCEQWQLMPSGTTQLLRAIHFPDAQNGWAAGSAGILLHSSNGGTTWVNQSAALGAGTSELYSVHFVTATTGWVVGSGGLVKKTTNGGSTWATQTTNTSTDLYDVYFTDANNGWIVGACGLILRTTNGGTAWNAVGSGQNYNLYAVSPANANNVAVASSGNVILRSSDNGTNWSASTGPASSNNFRSLAFSGATGWAASAGGTLWKTTNGGNLWLFFGSAAPNTGVWQSVSMTTNYVYVAGLGGKIVRSAGTSGFDDFSAGITNQNLYGLQMLDDNTGWAVGEGGVIFKYACVVASTCTVTTTNDAGPGSLREAINCANTNPGPDTIRFNIPGAGPHVIAPISNYADITGNNTIIDATTQPGWSLGNIVLDGINLNNIQEPILRVWPASGSVASPNRGFELYGVLIKNVPGNGLNITYARDFIIGAPGKGNVIYETGRLVSTGATGIQVWRCVNGVVQNNILGADQNLTPAIKRSGAGVAIWADSMLITDNIVKSPANGIVTLWYGPYPDYNYPDNITIIKNDVSLCDNGILVNDHSSLIRIGSDSAIDENIIWNNSAGVLIDTTNNQTLIARNQFRCNSGGIFYKEASARPVLPVIVSARTNYISGTATPNATVRVFINNATGCPTVNCQGNLYLGMATADTNGNWFLATPFANGLSEGDLITATSTTQGITSEFTACTAVMAAVCDQVAERAGLEALYNATNGDNWTNKTNWKTAAHVGTWYGIQVNNNGCVQCIGLDGDGIPCNAIGTVLGNNLTNTLPTTIAAFSELEVLNLYNNNLIGSIPGEVGQLGNLRALVLDNNEFTGPIPAQLGNLDKLVSLGLGGNKLSGAIPAALANADSLAYIFLQNNKTITGAIPPQLFSMPKLRGLYFQDNDLTGSVPNTVLQAQNLEVFFISKNRITGVPDMSSLPFTPDVPGYFAGLRLFENGLTFEHILPNITALNQTILINTSRYAPQDTFYRDTMITRNVGNLLTIDLGIDAGITTNVYQWYKNGQLWQTVTGDNKWLFNGLQTTDAGEYWVHVTNPNAPLLTLESRKITLVVNTCTLAGTPNIVSPNALCAGTATLLVSGTFSQYNWSNNATTVTTTVTQSGTYTVTVTDANGCTGTDSQSIGGSVPAPAPVISGPTALCGSSSTLTANAGFTQYNWSNNATTANLTVTQPGTYTVTVTDANGCTGTDSQSIGGSVPAPAPVITGPTALCGSSSTLAANAGFVQYIWSNNVNTANLTVIQPGTYTVTVTDANGCTGTSSQSISGTVPAPAPVISGPTALCGGSSTLTANAGFAQYNWSNNTTTANLTVTQPGTYTVTVTDANGCTGTDSQSVGGSVPAPAPVISGPTALCGSSSTLTANAGFTQYNWSNNATTANLTVTQPGTYTVTVTDANGCTGTDSQSVGGSVPAPAPVISGPTALCSGSSTLTANAGFTQYNWFNNATTANLTVTQPGTYTVTVTDANGCTGTDSQSVGGSVPAPAPVISGPTALCGSSSTLTANAGFTQYNWSNNATTANLTVTQPGTYTVTVTDANGCTGTSSQSIGGSVPAPAPVISAPTALCGSSSTLTANAGFVQYNWSNNVNTANLTVTQPGTYTVTVTDANGCTGTSSQSISGTVSAPAPVITGPTALCGGSSTLTANAGFAQYNWSNNTTTANLTVTQPGTYTVTVTDANGCTGTDSVDITAGAPFTVAISVSGDTLFCPGGSVALNGIVPPGGTAQWLFNGVPIPNATSVNWTADTTGVYTLLVEKDGCSAQSTPVQTTLLAAAIITLEEVLAAQCGAAVGAIELTVSNTSGNVTYQWSNNANTRNISGLVAGVYTVTVTNGNACTAVLEQEVAGTAAPQPELLGETLLKPGDKIVLSTTETYAAYLWSTGDVSSVLEVSTPGTYELTVTNADGCTGTLVAEVTSNLDDLLDDAELIIPRAISPYSTPGQNDGFDPVQALLDAQRPVDFAQNTRLIVYARQGEVVVVLDPYPPGGWVGELIPPDLPEGTYYYHLEFVFADGNKAVYKGALNLVR